MKVSYLIRFDDLSPTMNWSVWDSIERCLIDEGLRPILAVVPDNKDPRLCVDSANPHFWERVRNWQTRGWTIGLHGHQHLYVSSDSGLVGLNRRSEFAGLPLDGQRMRLENAVRLFSSEGVEPKVWVAPAHSFDENTLSILRDLTISVVSDGFSLFPHVDRSGVAWVPQQLWRFRPMPLGVWTVCFHHNRWSLRNLAAFQRDVRAYKTMIEDVGTVLARFRGRKKTWYDSAFASIWLLTLRARTLMRQVGKAADD